MEDIIFPNYRFNLDKLIEDIKSARAKSVGLQLPEGLKRRATALAKAIEEGTECQVKVYGEECFGACDVIIDPDVALVFNIGHCDIPNMETDRSRLNFVELQYETDYNEVFQLLPLGDLGRKTGLLATVQHVHALKGLKEFLEENGIRAVIAKGSDRLAHPGQVLGCNFSAATNSGVDIDTFVFLGSGMFHPLGVFLTLEKPVLILDPYSKLVAILEEEARDQYLKKRWGAISSAKGAQKFGIVVSRKPGQYRPDTAERMKALFQEAGKEAHLVIMDQITPQRLEAVGLDAYVITACPRIAIDDSGLYKRPLLTPVEAEVLIGTRENLVFDEIE
jgi:2-(3-amino-3-carboxypropyl)histidine synthase